MKFFHLFAITSLVLSFSGTPELKAPVTKTTTPLEDSVLKLESEELIPWQYNSRLQWEDFLCEPRRGTDAVASTSTSLGIAYQLNNGSLSYHITCYFNKEKSWGLLRTDYILAHEQGHFDITEIFARKLNQALQDYRFNRRTFKKDIAAIYESIVNEKESYQKAYDGQTDHSRNRKVQYDWLVKIDGMLAESAPYANYP